MAQNNWIDSNRAGLLANLPAVGWAVGSVFSNNQAPGTPSTSVNEAASYPGNVSATYYATDTGDYYVWDPAAQVWRINGQKISSIVPAGSTQLGATLITTRKVVVTTATVSTKGVLLPVAVTGMEVVVINIGATFPLKVYPNSHAFINGGSSNAADTTSLASFKTTVYQARDTTHWVTLRGA